MVDFDWDLEAYISASWTSIARDVTIWDTSITAKRGLGGYGITDRVARPGSLVATLDNSPANSGGKVGYYSPEHTNMRANFGRGTRVRLSITDGVTTKYIWHGWINDLQPTAGQFKSPTSYLVASDYMQKMVEHKLDLISVQENKRGDQLIQTVLDNMATAPINTSIETKSFVFDLGLFGEQDEKTTAMTAAQKICMSGLDYAFVRGNATDGETFIFQSEAARAALSSIATLTDTMSELMISSKAERRANKLTGTYTPVSVDPEPTTLLASLSGDVPIDAGETITFDMRFRDPAGKSVRISALDVVTAVTADTHYKMSAFKTSGGNDMNDYLALTVTAGGNKASVEATNSGPVRGWINKMDIYGRGVYLYDPLEVIVESGDADQAKSVDFYYLSQYARAKSFTEAMHQRTSTVYPEVDAVAFYADANATLMGYALAVDIGHKVTITETATGVDHLYVVNRVTYTIQKDSRLRVEWMLEYAGIFGDFFTLDDATKGVLDSAYVLSPF